MKRLKRIGRAKYRYEFEVNVCDVRGVPASVSSVAVVWQRSDQRLSTPPAVVEVADRVANFGAKLTNVCTLYGGAKDTFEPKMSTVKIVDYGASGRAAVVAQAELELSEVARGATGGAPQVKQLRMRCGKQHLGAELLLQLSVSARLLADGDDGEGGSGDGTPSEASEASFSAEHTASGRGSLTHEALAALDGFGGGGGPSTAPASSRPRSKWSGVSASAVIGASSKQTPQARIAELQLILADARAESARAESRIAVVQHRLRSEVLQSTEEVLERADGVRSHGELAKLYHRQLLLVLDQVERIAYDDGGAIGGGGGLSGLEAEVLQLRRELASAKVDLAEVCYEKNELEHVAARLNKQLAEVGRGARG